MEEYKKAIIEMLDDMEESDRVFLQKIYTLLKSISKNRADKRE